MIQSIEHVITSNSVTISIMDKSGSCIAHLNPRYGRVYTRDVTFETFDEWSKRVKETYDIDVPKNLIPSWSKPIQLEGTELQQAKQLLHIWLKNKSSEWKPGGWDYYKPGADLVDQTAKFLNIEYPWKEPESSLTK